MVDCGTEAEDVPEGGFRTLDAGLDGVALADEPTRVPDEVAVDAGKERVFVPEVKSAPPPRVRYQLAFGSPKHSPTVTALKPRSVSVCSMTSVRLYAV